jgi:hypothetical protein
LFADYPQAVRIVNRSGTVRSMVLVLADGDSAEFVVLTDDCGQGEPFYSLSPWEGGEVVDIDLGGDAIVPVRIADAVMHGVPFPRHGSLFGWRSGDAVTALIAVYSTCSLACREPFWAVLPLVGIPQTEWPPFTDEQFFGPWFWKYYRDGSTVCLADLIAATPGTVFWIDAGEFPGPGCCAVTRDITSPHGYILQRGRYVDYRALRAGVSVPSLDVLLAEARITDLAPRFRCTGLSTSPSANL